MEAVLEVTGTARAIIALKGSTVWSIGPDATVFEAIERMAEKNTGALPVVRGAELIGILSERDYTRKVILQGKSSKETLVREIMTSSVVTAKPDDGVTECMRIMTDKHVRHLPILEGTEMVGILSIGDIVRWLISAQKSTIDNLQRFITGDYPSGY
jgi:CBS domain-containing protein